jgi:hypothetical protein
MTNETVLTTNTEPTMAHFTGFPEGSVYILDNQTLVGYFDMGTITGMCYTHSCTVASVFGEMGNRLCSGVSWHAESEDFSEALDWPENWGSAWEIGGKPFSTVESDMAFVPSAKWLNFIMDRLMERWDSEPEWLHKKNLRCDGWWGTLWLHNGKLSIMGWFKDESGVNQEFHLNHGDEQLQIEAFQ